MYSCRLYPGLSRSSPLLVVTYASFVEFFLTFEFFLNTGHYEKEGLWWWNNGKVLLTPVVLDVLGLLCAQHHECILDVKLKCQTMRVVLEVLVGNLILGGFGNMKCEKHYYIHRGVKLPTTLFITVTASAIQCSNHMSNIVLQAGKHRYIWR